MIKATDYVYMNKSEKVENVGLAKEQSQVYNVVDKFFGTRNGWMVVEERTETVIDSIRSTFESLFREKREEPNVFMELRKLNIILCGGAITSIFSNAPINDLDFYLKDHTKLAEAKAFLKKWFPDFEIETVNAITYKRKSSKSRKQYTIQLITKFTGEPSEIFDWFDFTITHGAFDFSRKQFYLGDRFLTDLAKRRLVYSGSSQYPICAMYRTNKYVKRGYELPGATIMHIALSIVQLKIANYKELKEQLMGIDTIYLSKLIEAKQPDAPVDYGEFIFEAFNLIDRITGMTEAEEDDE